MMDYIENDGSGSFGVRLWVNIKDCDTKLREFIRQVKSQRKQFNVSKACAFSYCDDVAPSTVNLQADSCPSPHGPDQDAQEPQSPDPKMNESMLVNQVSVNAKTQTSLSLNSCR